MRSSAITFPCPAEDEYLEVSPRTSYVIGWAEGQIGHLVIGGRHSFIEPVDRALIEACLLLGFTYHEETCSPADFRDISQACWEQRLPNSEGEFLRDQLVLAGWSQRFWRPQLEERLLPLQDLTVNDILSAK
jgi:hypothetical protein